MSSNPTKARLEGASYMKELDGLRFIAVFAVMIGHYSMREVLFSTGRMMAMEGVNLFFVLSGFLITGILLQNKEASDQGQALGMFYIRRFLRIFPLYYVVLVLSFILNIPESRKYAWWLVFYVSNIPKAITHGQLGYMGHLWSLSVEEQFYIFFPLLILCLNRRNLLGAFIGVSALGIMSRVVLYFYFPDKNMAFWDSFVGTIGCLDCFGFGAILAYLKLYHVEVLKKILHQYRWIFLIMLPISIFLNMVAVPYPKNFMSMIFDRACFGLFSFWMVAVASLGAFTGIFRYILVHPIALYLGKISYGIFVYHYILPYFFEHTKHSSFILPFLTVGVAALSWHLLEFPMNRLKKNFPYPRLVLEPLPVSLE